MSQDVKTKILNVRCPKCGTYLNIKVDLDRLEFEGGISKVAVFHGEPPHSLILYIDEQGMLRGHEVADFISLLSKKEKLTEEEYKQFETHMGNKTVGAMYSAMIAGVPFYFITKGDASKPAEFIRQMMKDFPERVPILENDVLEDFGISVVNLDFFEDHKDEILNGIVYNLVVGDYEGNWGFNYMRDVAKKTLKKGYKGLVERYVVAKRLKLLFQKFLEEVQSSPSEASLKEVKKRLNLSNQEAKYFKEILSIRDPDLAKRVKDDIRFLGIL